jgi:hypothetical protein
MRMGADIAVIYVGSILAALLPFSSTYGANAQSVTSGGKDFEYINQLIGTFNGGMWLHSTGVDSPGENRCGE